ncbi:methyltransferase (plasmid) [Rhizobium grahamii CCGE 502]|uniref:Methyltransferase n=1 Tax=Rhizobium grahamii CCGE 502 TaxID=990285 RepID=S3I414_9HYPH|nr:methyltransferase [Rhizobium grahamii CCGE 502]
MTAAISGDLERLDASRAQYDGLTPDDVAALDYVGFISLIQETNRCPGGLVSLRRQTIASGIDTTSEVLEIGSNTGFTSIELVKMSRCRVTGIEPNAAAVSEARRRAALLPPDLQDRVKFEIGDARRLHREPGSIDVIVCGGANTFIDGRDAAFAEYRRVLRPLGRVTLTNFFYVQPPSQALLQRLRNTIGVDIPPWDQRQWLRMILDGSFWDVISLGTHPVVARPTAVVKAYVDYMVDRPALADLRPNTREAVRRRWQETCDLFNENAAQLSFFELVLRRPIDGMEEQPPLFLSPGEYDRWFAHDIVAAPKDLI